MTPDTPGTPDEGTVDDAKLEQEAAESKATPEPQTQPTRRRPARKKAEPQAEGTAAEATGVDKDAAEAAPAAAKPARRPSRTPSPSRSAGRDRAQVVTVRAHARYVRSSARKARLVCDTIRGKSVDEARAILAFSPRHVAQAWTKLLESAVANAENNHELDGADLKVHAAFADEGPTIKRFRPRAMGRATRINKRTSHLTIQLTPRS